MSFDAIFDQPEIISDLDDLTFEVTTYLATATCTGTKWTVTADDLPNGKIVQAEGVTWLEAEEEIQKRVPESLGVDRSTIVVSVEPADTEAKAALRALTAARITRSKAEQVERDAARYAARLLAGQGWTTRDVGMMLRLPSDRIAQLAVASSGEAI